MLTVVSPSGRVEEKKRSYKYSSSFLRRNNCNKTRPSVICLVRLAMSNITSFSLKEAKS